MSLRIASLAVVCALASLTVVAADPPAVQPFYLRDGDRVVFYGDSITEQANYTRPIDLYVCTRCPNLHVSFINSGWSGDRAWGGDGGMLEERLNRDVIAHRPTVVTVMLGMNDGYYTNFDAKGLAAFDERIEFLTATLRRELLEVRITLIGASPYDNITSGELPEWEREIEGGYNSVVARYSQAMRKFAARHDLAFVDMNAPLVAALQKLQAEEPSLARELIPDRIHPGPAAGLLMAARILNTWNAPVREHVTHITMQGAVGSTARVRQELPLPFPIDTSDPLTKNIAASVPEMSVFGADKLRVTGLQFETARVELDGSDLGEFSRSELQFGVNLSPANSILDKRAAQLADLAVLADQLQFTRWRQLSVEMGNKRSQSLQAMHDDLVTIETQLREVIRRLAQPASQVIQITGIDE